MIFWEVIPYFFYKRKLKSKIRSFYEVEDPWSSAYLSGFFAPILRQQMQQLPPELRSAPVLDAGGGEGHFGQALQDLLEDYHLLDIEPQALERARERLGKVRNTLICKGLDEFYPPAATYGAIWLFSVLNYAGADRYPVTFTQITKTLWRSLKPKGIVILLHPAELQNGIDKTDNYHKPFLTWGGVCLFESHKQAGKQFFNIRVIQKP